jgi:hypothetical protein
MRGTAWGIAAALACGLAAGMLLGCPKAPPSTSSQKNEITALWTQIRDWRLEAGLAVEPAAGDIARAPKTVGHARAICRPNPSTTQCGDVCDLADAICDNAERICDLAQELDGDSWANGKCTSAKTSCREAKQRCCSCDDQAARKRLRGDDEDREN